MHLDNEWMRILIEQAEYISFTHDLFHKIHLSVGNILSRMHTPGIICS